MTTMATRPPASQSVPACVSAGNGAEGLTLVRNVSRRIVHVDMDAFYASVELLSYPELREKPVAVCGDPAARHGIILAKNEAAKAQGVKTAETIWQARRKCPAAMG